MVIFIKQNTKEERIQELLQWIESQNLRTHVSTGDFSTVIGVIGDTSKLDEDLIGGLDIVEGQACVRSRSRARTGSSIP